ncbi:valine--tRNA ligase [Granulicatella adiacens ATCC 49175]|uniref:Valine--tRNA ligase n=1 Tax=Granulicatella adiacens ATCC 49175 TaxID=638301 RepID=C8NGA8_9LACT|nr:valine--tRNA ligase [Granulicatella adiacens]EEW37320.1 valine--tRNA ligase [Granulicatella adiacens ATCC 49175]UAK93214.1 valine--tRNA ligase [Granulicatella adiacens]UWP37792.1 valine--tRNA ligase [Granulicatella adiacens ATCC 49175]
MAKEMSSKFQPQEVEAGKYQWWVDSGVFHPNEDPNAEPYSIVIPPPNVTGKLHLGHAWDVTLQDMIIRQKRMQGFDTLWLPGMDHAGIATQAKVEEKLRGEGLSRYDLGREKFLEQTWKWKEEYASHIREQWAKMGISVDYRRERFTLDNGLSDAVKKVFVTLYEKGLIYRGEYIINWDPKAKTSLSDIEVIHKDVEGAFYHMNYPLADGSGFLEIATTRPETLLGDTAVAVHPYDERYQALIGKTVILPLMNREIPIIADEYVEQDFGTGVVKITPAHDPNDFEVGNRHNLPRINVMNDDATMNELAGKYEGMDRFAARKAIVKDLEEAGLLVKIEKHLHSVGHSERTDVVVEPRLSKQWFVKMGPLAQQAINAQRAEGDNTVNFYPPRFNDAYLRWMENIHDWVISRQLWWGHQIPAWYHKETGEVFVGMEAPSDSENWTQDPDVLDTWFSSALWPFSTMGWPDEDAADYKRYYPTNTLVTGYDILTFWVSRMMFQGLEFTGKRPFKNVLIHGLIRDSQGRKMSKSLGNGVDPMEVIEQYGADALRWFLANGSAPGQDVRYSTDKMDAAWNFINKIWNASRYALMNVGDLTADQVDITGEKTLADKWILTRLNQTIGKVTELFEKFEFGEAGRLLYRFIWDDFCDWYIEMSKETLAGDDEAAKLTTRSILVYVLDNTLRLLHPIMPFVTEEIWQSVPHVGESLVVATYPTVHPEQMDEKAAEEMEFLMDFIRSVRMVRNEMNTPLSKPINIIAKVSDTAHYTVLKENESYIARFSNPEEFVYGEDVEAPSDAVTSVITGAEIYLPLAGLINIEDEIARLEKEAEKLQQEVDRVEKKLSNEKFVAKAPAAVVEAERAKGADYQAQREAVLERIATLKKI